jgi:chloride channel 7
MRDGMLSTSTLVAKVVGITLITSTNLPLGRDGPMVHIGAMCAAILTRANIPGTATLLELRLPGPQREWVAVGAVAGVAAAFNAPIGGILYSFEEVSPSWRSNSKTLTPTLTPTLSLILTRTLTLTRSHPGGTLCSLGDPSCAPRASRSHTTSNPNPNPDPHPHL